MQATTFRNIYSLFNIFFLTTLLISCGGGSGSSDEGSSDTISGTVATGEALVGVVNIYGINGGEIIDVQIDSSGQYSVDVAGLTAPYLLEAIPDNSLLDTQYSFANSSGITNITPLTSLMLFYANGEQNPGQLSTSWPSEASNILATAIDAQEAINANLMGLFPLQNIDFTTYDFLTTSFSIGDAFDQILEQISISITNNTLVAAISGNPTFVFNSSIDVSAINIGGSNDTNSSTGALGSLTLSGVGTSVLSSEYLKFTPTTVEDSTSVTSGKIFKSTVPNANLGVVFGLNNKVYSLIYTSLSSNSPELLTQWIKIDFINNISGVVYDGSAVTFNNVIVSSDKAGDIVFNGKLNVSK